jgi:transposase-like protein
MASNRIRYSKEFKASAVEKVTVHGVMLTRAAEELGISAGVLSKWVKLSKDTERGEGERGGEPAYADLEARLKRVEGSLESIRKILEMNLVERIRNDFPSGPRSAA